MAVITLDNDCRELLLRKKAQKRRAGTNAFYRMVNAIREELLSQDQADDLGDFITARLGNFSEPSEEDSKFRGVLTRQPAHRCHGNGGCDHHAANPFAIVNRVVDQQIGHDCENCGSGEKISEEIKEANLAIGEFKIAAKKSLITPDQFFEVLQWLRACYDYKPTIRRGAMTEGGATVHNLDKYRKTHPRSQKDKRPRMFGPDSPIFLRLMAAIQSGSFLDQQAKELAERLSEKWGVRFLGLPADKLVLMRDHAAKRRLKKIEPGEVAILIALAKHSLDYKDAQVTIEWLYALYEI
ncbi:MAG: hypothetical protein HY813_01330 [Candidatus Portnoybacteria bacterium]|nr:hypothetical protein [Candidatus Portnoybacteria bacterium]